MKVCILTTSFPLGKGDISGMFVLEQARHLIKHGAAVCVVAPHHDGVVHHEDMNGIEVHRFRYFLPEKLQKLCYGSGIPNNIREFPWTKLQLPLLVFLFTIHASQVCTQLRYHSRALVHCGHCRTYRRQDPGQTDCFEHPPWLCARRYKNRKNSSGNRRLCSF